MTKTRPTFATDMLLYVEALDTDGPMVWNGVDLSEYHEAQGHFEAYVEGNVYGKDIDATYWQPAEYAEIEITKVTIGDVDFTDKLAEQAKLIVNSDWALYIGDGEEVEA